MRRKAHRKVLSPLTIIKDTQHFPMHHSCMTSNDEDRIAHIDNQNIMIVRENKKVRNYKTDIEHNSELKYIKLNVSSGQPVVDSHVIKSNPNYLSSIANYISEFITFGDYQYYHPSLIFENILKGIYLKNSDYCVCVIGYYDKRDKSLIDSQFILSETLKMGEDVMSGLLRCAREELGLELSLENIKNCGNYVYYYNLEDINDDNFNLKIDSSMAGDKKSDKVYLIVYGTEEKCNYWLNNVRQLAPSGDNIGYLGHIKIINALNCFMALKKIKNEEKKVEKSKIDYRPFYLTS